MIFISKKYLPFVVGNVLAVTLACVLTVGNTYVFKNLIDSFGSPDALWQWGVVYVLVFLLIGLLWRFSGVMGLIWMPAASSDSYAKLFAYLSRHSSAYFDDRFAGALASKVTNASEGVRRMMSIFCWNLYPVIVSTVASLLLVLTVGYLFALVLICWAVIFVAIDLLIVKFKKPHAVAYANAASTLRGQMVDVTTNVKAMNHFARRRHEMERLYDYIRERTRTHRKNWFFGEMMLTANSVMQSVFLGAMLILALWFYQNAGLSLGGTIMIITVSNYLKDQLMWIGTHINDLLDYYGETKEGLDEILQEHQLKDGKKAYPLAVNSAGIDFNKIAFRYGQKFIFRNFSLHIAPGQKVGLVGESGAGKSTLVSLLMRQHDLQEGEILINDHNIANVTQESLRASIATVPQEPLLFHRSIMENIRYGKLEATDEEVIEAAKLAQAHDFIVELAQGYETLVGERGVKLSGGQRQRVAIARAILKNAPILVLDEATSSLDSESEGEIQKALHNLMKDKTVIAIAHRLSTIRAMDRTVVIEGGEIVQDGFHDELLKQKGGIYQKLWQKQSEGFI